MSVIGLLIPIAIILLVMRIGKTPKKVTHWLLYAYIGLAALATLSIPFITDEAQKLEKISEADLHAQSGELHAHLRQGQWESVDDQWLMAQNSFAIESVDTLRLASERDDFFLTVYVEHKEQHDGTIDAFVFRDGGFIIDGYDFSFKLEPLYMYYRDETLTLAPHDQSISLSFASPEFTIRQFSGKSFMDRWGSSGVQIVYLRIPQGIEVIANEDDFSDVHYVNQ